MFSVPQVTEIEDEEDLYEEIHKEDDPWTVADETDQENTLFDMDEFVLQESSGYMKPALRIFAISHTIISLLCLLGYYLLKVWTHDIWDTRGSYDDSFLCK